MTDPLEGLHDIQLPDAGWPEAFAGLALGIALSLLIGFLLRFIARRRISAKDRVLSELATLGTASREQRLFGQAKILQRIKPGAIAGLSEALYRRESDISPDDVERQLVSLIKAARL